MAGGAFILNRDRVDLGDLPAAMPVLDALRHRYRLSGCKEACREGDCGACLILLGKLEHDRLVYRPLVSCLLPLAAVAGAHVVTIEGLNGEQLNPMQQALVDEGAIQCGFCTPGIVLALTAFFLNGEASNVDAAVDAVAGNLCRCTGYGGIKRAIAKLCAQFDLAESPPANRLRDGIAWQILPAYFGCIAERLEALPAADSADSELGLPVGGGTDLWVQRADALLDQPLNWLAAAGPNCVRLENGQCRIDAAASIEQLRTSTVLQACLPTLAGDLQWLASAPIRQRATLAGNLANASPIADLAVLFLALDATLELVSAGTSRSLPLRAFFLGYKQTALQPGERLQALRFDTSVVESGFSFEKVAKRSHLDLASVNSACSMRLEDGAIASVHLAAGGIAPVPLYLAATCDYLRGKTIDASTVTAAADIAQTEIAPIGDLRGSVEYKRLLLRQLLFAHFLKLFPGRVTWEALHAQG